MIDLKENNIGSLTVDSLALLSLGGNSQFTVQYTLIANGLEMGPISTYGLENDEAVKDAIGRLVDAVEEALANLFGVSSVVEPSEPPKGLVDFGEI